MPSSWGAPPPSRDPRSGLGPEPPATSPVSPPTVPGAPHRATVAITAVAVVLVLAVLIGVAVRMGAPGDPPVEPTATGPTTVLLVPASPTSRPRTTTTSPPPRPTAFAVPVEADRVPRAPQIVDGKVVVLSGPTVTAFDLATGSAVWSRDAGCAQPAFADGLLQVTPDHILVQCEQVISSLDPASGVERWRTPPTCIDHQVSVHWVGCRLSADAVQVFSIDDGAPVFQVVPGATPFTWIFAGREVIVSTRPALTSPTTTDAIDRGIGPLKIAFDDRGVERWRAERRGSVRGTADGLFVMTPTTVSEIDLTSGAPRWSRRSPNEEETVVATTPTLVLLTDEAGSVVALDRPGGGDRWRYAPGEAIRRTPRTDPARPALVVGDGHVVAVALAPGDPISGLTIFDESDGRVEHRDPSVRASGLAIGAGSIAYTEGFAPKAAVVVERLP